MRGARSIQQTYASESMARKLYATLKECQVRGAPAPTPPPRPRTRLQRPPGRPTSALRISTLKVTEPQPQPYPSPALSLAQPYP